MNAHHRLLVAAAVAATLTSPAQALEHSGTQSGRWNAVDSPHVVTGDVLVPAGQGLVIEAGSVVLFEPGAGFEVAGTLVANGGPGEPIALLSRELQPRAGDWEGLRISESGAAWLTSVSLRHAANGIVVLDGGSLDAQGTTVADSMEDGVRFAAAALGSLVDCTLERSGGSGLVIEGGAPLVAGCTLRLNDVAATMNADAYPLFIDTQALLNRSLDAVLVDTAGPVSSFGTWRGGGLPFVIPDGSVLSVGSGAKLGLDGGTVLKLGAGARLKVEGDLSAAASRQGPVLLTSLLDDEAAGDTNRDGDATAPAKGDWSGVDVLDGGSLSFTGVELRLADDGLRVQAGGRVVLYGCELHGNAGRGLGVGVGGQALVQDSSFHDNDTGVQVADTTGIAIGLVPGNEPTGGDNTFHCNAAFDIENTSAFLLQARRNFWGATPPDASRFLGAVDTGDWLIHAPPAVLAGACLGVSREGTTDLRFDWSEISSCSRYQLASADRADGIFGAFTAPTLDETHLESGGALAEGRPVRYFKLLSDLETAP